MNCDPYQGQKLPMKVNWKITEMIKLLYKTFQDVNYNYTVFKGKHKHNERKRRQKWTFQE